MIAYQDGTKHISKFGGEIRYINKGSGANTNSGKGPDEAFETIGAGIIAMGDGDALSIKAGTYIEVGLNLSNVAAEMWFEIGVILDPASGTALTISGDHCRLTGGVFITPAAAQTGLLITGNYCRIGDVGGPIISGGGIGICVTGIGVAIYNSACPLQTIIGYDIQGDVARLYSCSTAGNSASIGYYINGNADRGTLRDCTSIGHATAGFSIATNSAHWLLSNCTSGAGDGRWVDVDHANVWSDLHYDDEIHSTTTFAGVATTYDIFTLTGAVRIGEIFGTVETVIPNTASNIHLELYSDAPSSVDITDGPGVNIQNAVVGAILVRNGPSTDALDLANPNAAPAVAENTNWRDPKTAVDIVKDDTNPTVVRLVLSAALASGAIDWHCQWEPLSDDGFLVAA